MNNRNFLLIYCFLLLSHNATSQVLTQKFNTYGYVKAKGVNFSVHYPSKWDAKDGDRPNIVQKFCGEFKGYTTLLMIQVKKAEENIESECKTMSALDMAEVMAGGDKSIKIENPKKTSHQNKPAFIFDMSQQIERAGLSFIISNRLMTVCQKEKMITLCAEILKQIRLQIGFYPRYKIWK